MAKTVAVALPAANRKPTRRDAMVELALRSTRSSFQAFFAAHEPAQPYMYGRHTLALLDILDGVVRDVERGKCRYVIVNEAPRHGKSDLVSRRFPVYALVRNPDWEIILASYNHDLAAEMSFDARLCYQTVAPDYDEALALTRAQVGSWRTAKGGGVYAAGIGGTITGRGAKLLIIDDYMKSRVEAESPRMRETVRLSFQHDLMTRRAPVHAVVIVANRWHVDDLCGWIVDKKNNPKSPEYDPNFPVFEVVRFPAQSEAYKAPENPEGWLFPERFSPEWYKSQRAVTGSYGWSAQFLQDPHPRTGNLLRADKVVCLTRPEFAKLVEQLGGVRWRRGWDVASTRKERASHDPDYTVGTKAAVKNGKLLVQHVARGRWSTLKRNSVMTHIAKQDGSSVGVRVEAVAGYVDTYNQIRNLLMGLCTVRKVSPTSDLVARSSVLEPIFEIGEVYIEEGEWNEAWLNEMASFPEGHDDQVASLLTAVEDLLMTRGRMGLSRL